MFLTKITEGSSCLSKHHHFGLLQALPSDDPWCFLLPPDRVKRKQRTHTLRIGISKVSAKEEIQERG